MMPTGEIGGELTNSIKKYNEAIIVFTNLIEKNDNNAKAYIGRGASFVQLGYYNNAIKDFLKAITLSPNNSKVYLQLGIVYFRLTQFNEAILYYTKAIVIDYKTENAFTKRGVAYMQIKMYHKAISDFNIAININNKDEVGYLNRAKAYSNILRFDNAITDLKRVLNLNPKNDFAISLLSYIKNRDFKNKNILLSDPSQKGLFKIKFTSGTTVETAQYFLYNINKAYSNLVIINNTQLLENFIFNKNTKISLPIKDKLYINKIQISSPGIWEFLGSINPLLQLREYLNDRHERNKDEKFRNEQERKFGDIEVQSKINNLIEKRIEILISLGYSKKEIKKNYENLLQPFKNLIELEKSNLIQSIEVDKIDTPANKV